MSVSSNSVSYHLLLLSLFLTPFLLSGSNALSAKYSCIKQKDKEIIAFFVDKESDTVQKIYAKGKESTCSTPNQITGTGTGTDPYKLTIDSDSDSKCGVKKTGKTASITFIIKKGTGVFAAASESDVACDFTNAIVEAEVNSDMNLEKDTATKLKPAVTMEFEPAISPIDVGTDISLKLSLTKYKEEFKGIKPYKCWAKRSQEDEMPVQILNNYCAVNGAPAKLVFTPDTSDPTISKSATFQAFRFFDSDKLFITCQVDVCVDATKCAKEVCNGRKKRSANDQPTHLVTTNASIVIRGKGSSLL